jgi:hypothetical protein
MYTTGCGGKVQTSSDGVSVWANDCSGIALDINYYDNEDELFSSHPGNYRYDLVLCDAAGNVRQSLLTQRKIDGEHNTPEMR